MNTKINKASQAVKESYLSELVVVTKNNLYEVGKRSASKLDSIQTIKKNKIMGIFFGPLKKRVLNFFLGHEKKRILYFSPHRYYVCIFM